MTITIVTTEGRIVIPAKIRRRLNIKKGTRVCVVEKDGQLILKPLISEYFRKISGVLNTKGKLTKAILKERTKRVLSNSSSR